ncbi:MAG: hypothetical protein M3Y08_02415 [Fibrobacterota bacterium]|nr:hypothetical protein [Fibrobacterota bacterium]
MNYISKIFVIVLSSIFAVLAKPVLKLTADKTQYLVYQPVYLKIERVNEPSAGEPRFIALEYQDIVLEITYPNKEKGQYKPPMQVCMGLDAEFQKIAYSTLILSEGKIVTSQPGSFSIRLLDLNGNQVSPASHFSVSLPKTVEDRKALDLINSNPQSFAWFIYLEGGDHIPNGMDITQRLAGTNSSYAGFSQSVLALNFSEVAYDFTKNKIKRDRDFEKVRALFLVGSEESNGEYLQLRVCESMVKNFDKKNYPKEWHSRIRAVKNKYNSDLVRSDILTKINTLYPD